MNIEVNLGGEGVVKTGSEKPGGGGFSPTAALASVLKTMKKKGGRKKLYSCSH